MSRYRFINRQGATHRVRLLCHVLRVPASGYYAWPHAQQQSIAPSEPAWKTALVKALSHDKRHSGTRRLQVVLRRNGHRVGRHRLRVVMRRRGLRALQIKALTPRTTD